MHYRFLKQKGSSYQIALKAEIKALRYLGVKTEKMEDQSKNFPEDSKSWNRDEAILYTEYQNLSKEHCEKYFELTKLINTHLDTEKSLLDELTSRE